MVWGKKPWVFPPTLTSRQKSSGFIFIRSWILATFWPKLNTHSHTAYSTHSLSFARAWKVHCHTLWEKKSWRGIKQSHSQPHYLCRTKSAAATHKTQTLTEPVEIIMKTERNRHTRMDREKKRAGPVVWPTAGRADCVELKREKKAMDRILLFCSLPGALAKRYAGKADVLTGHEIKTGNNFHRT